eukprot:TRINITY_DN2060_c0_g1_i23.p1 TRINITY_DN2060_c0_g1~~TRINITY_DN2060_c0_g1_i23.p1  ORF type:complete len:439 (-),score=157.44 TRINITY_DN2060_c0_g1_i23:160-1476(-)
MCIRDSFNPGKKCSCWIPCKYNCSRNKMKKPWERTKEACAGFSRMPPLTEATLTKPSFRTILGIVNSAILYCRPLWQLFTEKELTYASYNDIESEAKFLDCLVQFTDKCSSEAKLGFIGAELVGKKRNAEKVHKLLQRFIKIAKVGKLTAKEVKEFVKTKEEFLPGTPEKSSKGKLFATAIKQSPAKETPIKIGERKGFATVPSEAWGKKSGEKEPESRQNGKSPYEVLKEVQELKMKKRELASKQARNKGTIGKLEKEQRQLEEQLSKKKSELEELQCQSEVEQERQSVAHEYSQLAEELLKKRNEVDKLRSKLEQNEAALEFKLQPIKADIERIKKKNDEYREVMNLNESAILESSRSPDDIKEKEEEIEKFKQENKELASQIEELKSVRSSESRVLLAELRSNAADLRKLADEKEKLEESITKLRKESSIFNNSP